MDVLERAAPPAAARRPAGAAPAVPLPRPEDRGGEPELRGLARALRALVRRHGLPAAARAFAPAGARARDARRPAAVRFASGREPAAAHAVLRPDELAAGQPARARRPHDHGRLD